EHTSELQSRRDLVCRLLLEKSSDVCSDRKSTRLNSSHLEISYAVFCLKKKKAAGDARPCPGDVRLAITETALMDNPEQAAWILVFFFLMIRRPPRSTLFPDTTPFR